MNICFSNDARDTHLAKARPVSTAEADSRTNRRPLEKVIVSVLTSRQSEVQRSISLLLSYVLHQEVRDENCGGTKIQRNFCQSPD